MKDIRCGKKVRKSFSRIDEVLEMPNLIEVQKKSYKWFLDEGLRQVFKDVGAITDYTGNLELTRPPSIPSPSAKSATPHMPRPSRSA